MRSGSRRSTRRRLRYARRLRFGPQLVQIGAFGETDQVSAAMAMVDGLGAVRVEPAFVGDRAVARVRLGPVPDPASAASAAASASSPWATRTPSWFRRPAPAGRSGELLSPLGSNHPTR